MLADTRRILRTSFYKPIAVCPAIKGALLLARLQVGWAEFLVISLWESEAFLKALAGGPHIEKAIVPLEAHPDLLNPTPLVKHYEVMV